MSMILLLSAYKISQMKIKRRIIPVNPALQGLVGQFVTISGGGTELMMKKLAGIIVLVNTLTAGAQPVQKQRFSQPVTANYPLVLHVTHSFISLVGGVSMHLVGV